MLEISGVNLISVYCVHGAYFSTRFTLHIFPTKFKSNLEMEKSPKREFFVAFYLNILSRIPKNCENIRKMSRNFMFNCFLCCYVDVIDIVHVE